MRKTGRGGGVGARWIPAALVLGAVAVVALSVLASLLRDRGGPPEPRTHVIETETAASPIPVAQPQVDLPPLPQSVNVRQAADHTRIRQLVAQYRESVVNGSAARAGAVENLILREGGYATPFVDRAIAESGNARVREALGRLRSRLPEPIVVTGPTQGPPPP